MYIILFICFRFCGQVVYGYNLLVRQLYDVHQELFLGRAGFGTVASQLFQAGKKRRRIIESAAQLCVGVYDWPPTGAAAMFAGDAFS